MKVAALSRTRTVLAVALTLALAVLGSLVIVRYRHDHRTEYSRIAVPWDRFEVSDDHGTLTFFAIGSPCEEPDHMELEGSDPITATAIYRIATRVDGEQRMCAMSLGSIPPVSIELDEPLADGTVIVDGAEPSPFFCDRPARQSVGEHRNPYNGGVSC